MYVELVDVLRCPVPHEESWLVAAAARTEARHIVEGTLGCPVCRAEYPIHEGVVDFRRGASEAAADRSDGDAEQAMRLAAMLNLADGEGFAVLLGGWGAQATLLANIAETPLILVDPPRQIVGAPGISVIRCDGALPLATGAARAVAIDVSAVARVASAVRATRVQGRVLAPVDIPLPQGVRELARDGSVWIGEREAEASPFVTLHVRRGV